MGLGELSAEALEQREKKIKKEKNRLIGLFKGIDETKKKTVLGLIDRASFLRVLLEELEADINQHGAVELFSQGDQEPYDRARPQGQAYQTLNKNYQAIIKQLDGMLPVEEGRTQPKDDGFDSFVGSRDAE